MTKREVLWTEDDATVGMEDHETLERAWRRLFAEDLDREIAVRVKDHRDCVSYQMPNGCVAVSSWPGNSKIYRGEL